MFFEFLSEASSKLDVVRAEVSSGPKPWRHTSATLKAMMLQRWPGREALGDALLLQHHLTASMVHWTALSPEEFELRLKQLRELIVAMHPCISSQQVYLSNASGTFKAYFVPLGETTKVGKHMSPVRAILRSDRELVLKHMAVRRDKLEQRLRNKFVVGFGAVKFAVESMSSSADPIQWLLAAICCSGARKGEVMSPGIVFRPWQQGDPLIFGSQDINPLDLPPKVCEAQLFVQIGVWKDRRESDNRFGAAHQIPARVVVKPALFLTSVQLCSMIENFRTSQNFTVEMFKDRVPEAKLFNTQKLRPYLQHHFRDCFDLAMKSGLEFSSHFCRKIYANLCFDEYGNAKVDRDIFLGVILGHDKGMGSALSYANVTVDHGQTESVGTAAQSVKKRSREIVVDGVALQRRNRRRFEGAADKDAEIRIFMQMLSSKGLKTTNNNLMRLGFSKQTVLEFRRRNKQ